MKAETGLQDFASVGGRVTEEYVSRVTNSAALKGSSSLPRLLEYLARRSREAPGESVKEFRIATEVLGRGNAFDSRTDSVVRVTTARLRSKLEQYYAGEGADDPIRLSVPKGAYRLVVRPRSSSSERPAAKAAAATSRPTVRPGVLIAAAGGAVVLALAGYAVGYSAGPPRRAVPDPELVRLWSEFAGANRAVRVVYSNVPHGVTSYGRVTGANHASDGASDEWHTGVGEVESVLRLANLANSLDIEFALKRALLVDWDEVLDVNVIYLGGPGANPQVAELSRPANFVFDQVPVGDQTQFVIRNRAPAVGEREVYASSLPLETDYAIVRLTRGFREDRWTLLLAGITTFGTAAAVELVTDPDLLRSARRTLDQDLEDPLKPFECIVELALKENVPFESRVKACRLLMSSAGD